MVRSGLGWQIIGLLLYTFAILPCCSSLPILISAVGFIASDVPDASIAAIFFASSGAVLGLLGMGMLAAGYRIRRSWVAEPDDEAATHP